MIELQKFLIEISSATSESQIDQIILDAIRETSFVAFLFSLEKDFFNYVGSADPTALSEDRLLDGLRIPIGQAIAPFATRKYALIDNLSQKSEYSDLLPFFLNRGCKSAALLPLNVNEKISRLLIIGSRDEEAIGQTDILPIQEILIASEKVLSKRALESSSEKQIKALEIYRSLTELISKENNPARILPFLHSQLQQIFGKEKDFIAAIHDTKTNVIQFLYVFENGKIQNPKPIPYGEGLFSYIIENKKTIAWSRQASNVIQRLGVIIRETLAKSFIGVPLMINGEAIGTMAIADQKEEDAFQDTDITLMNSIGIIIAAVLSGIRANQEKIDQLEKSAFDGLVLTQLLDNSPINISVKDPQGKYLKLNKQLQQQIGLLNMQDAIGQSDINLMDESGGLQNYKDDLDVLSSGFPRLAAKITRKLQDGSEINLTQNKIPLKDNDGKTLGLLEVSWDDTELSKSKQLAEEREAQIKLAAEVIHSNTQTISLEEQLKELTNGIQSNMKLLFTGIFLLDPQKEFAIFKQGSGAVGEKHILDSYQIKIRGKGIINQVLSDGNFRVVTDTNRDQNHLEDQLIPETRSELLIPLKTSGEILGFIDYRSDKPNFFSPANLQILQVITDQISLIISNASQVEKTKEYLARQRSMYLITSIATTAPTVETAYLNVVEGLTDSLPNSQIAIFVPDNSGIMTIRASKGYEKISIKDIKIPIGEGVIGQVAGEKRTILIDDVKKVENYIPLDPNTQSELAIPILFRDTFLGVINIESPVLQAFNENDVEILSTLANSLGSIISSVQLVGQIREQVDRQQQLYSITDKIRRSVDIDTILKTSVEELGKALNANHTEIQITGAQDISEDTSSLSGSTYQDESITDTSLASKVNEKRKTIDEEVTGKQGEEE